MVSRTTHPYRALVSLSAITLGLSMGACQTEDGASGEVVGTATSEISAPAATFSATFARQWMTNVAFSVKFDGIDPPTASRAYAYAAITAYEAVVHGMPGFVSMAGQVNGLDSLPLPDGGASYDWPTVLAAAMGRAVNATYVFPNTAFFEYTTATHVSLGTLERDQVEKRRVSGVPQTVIDASTSYGHLLGDAIGAWANADGYAEKRYLNYVPPSGDDKWVATGYVDAQTARPLLPHFGEVRPVALMSADDCLPAPPVAFSSSPSSPFYAQANTVYTTDLALTKEQRETALYWADGSGSETPPGHWVKIANDLVRPGNLADAVRTYVAVAVPMFDAGIATWNAKYFYDLLRPETYIHRYINAQWISLLPTPQFPSYTSGHSGFSAAAASGLTSVFGSIPFTDKTKVRGGFEQRSYPNFQAAADDAAQSRLFAGIHYPMDNEQGEVLGHCVADAFSARVVLHP
jgi:membrane-associated phospholipid phosphatase